MGFFDFLPTWLRDLICRLLGICDCKADSPPRSCPISWQPSVLAPVFYGVRDYSVEHGAPGPCRVFFPSLDGAVFDAPILEACGKYPLVIFCHGHCGSEAEHNKKWFEIPAELARSGYVVAVPFLPQIASGAHPSGADADLQLLKDLATWMRAGWEHASTLMAEPATGIAGHSFGALLAGRFATESSVAAYASLSGVWQDWPDSERPIETLTVPQLFTWGDPLLDLFASLDDGGLWARVPPTKHKAVFAGAAHFDYLRAGRTACGNQHGACEVVHVLAADILATFFAKYLPPPFWPNLRSCIPNSLIARPFKKTFEQEFFAGGHLMGLQLIKGRRGCSVTLSWVTPTSSGSVTRP
jgi:dienelactone hydrolase